VGLKFKTNIFNHLGNLRLNYFNTRAIFNDVHRSVRRDNNLNGNGSSTSGTIGKSNFRITVTGDYSGTGNFLRQKSLRERR